MKLHRWGELGGGALLTPTGLRKSQEAPGPAGLQVRVCLVTTQEATYRVELLDGGDRPLPSLNFLEFGGANEVRGTPLLRLENKYWRLSPQGIWEDVPAPVGLRVRDLTFRREERSVLEGVDLDVRPGQLVGVMGPSGCGKSTMMRCLLGELRPDSGGVAFLDEQGVRVSVPTVGYVPQENLLYPYLSVEESMRYMRRIRGGGVQSAEAEELLQRLELQGVRCTRVSRLSGGEAKRLNVALELQQLPQLLILDEPTSGLDPRIQDELMDLLRAIAHSGITVLCVTHDLSLVRKLDQVLILRSLVDQPDCGSVVYQGDATQLEAKKLFESYAPECRWTVDGGTASELPETVAGTGAAHEPSRRQQVLAVCIRSRQRLLRNRQQVWMSLVLPGVMALLIVLSQLRPGNAGFASVLLFSTVALLWLAMNFGVREIVSEWSLYRRDRRSGLVPLAYILGKGIFVSLVATVQLILFGAAFMLFARMQPDGLEMAPQLLTAELAQSAWFPLLLLGWTGALSGLMVSTWCRSEALAVTLVPLMLIPHLLFNRISYHGASTLENQPHLYGPAPESFSLAALQDVDPEMNRLEFNIHSLASAGLITRPVLNQLVYGVKAKEAPASEKLYIFWLWMLQSLITVGGFGVMERVSSTVRKGKGNA